MCVLGSLWVSLERGIGISEVCYEMESDELSEKRDAQGDSDGELKALAGNGNAGSGLSMSW